MGWSIWLWRVPNLATLRFAYIVMMCNDSVLAADGLQDVSSRGTSTMCREMKTIRL